MKFLHTKLLKDTGLKSFDINRYGFLCASTALVFITLKSLYISSQPEWFFTGDTANNFNLFSYFFSSISHGEYPYWNPLVRTGERIAVFNATQLASPIVVIPSFFISLFGVSDLVTVFSIIVILYCIVYVSGIYAFIFCVTENHSPAAIGAILGIVSGPIIYAPYHLSFILILHAIPWLLFAIFSYYKTQRLTYIIIFFLASSTFLYSYEFVMGLLFLLIMCFMSILMRFHAVPISRIKLKNSHVIIGMFLCIVSAAPLFFMYLDFKELLPINKLENLRITEDFNVSHDGYKTTYRFIDYVLQPKLWITFFSGAYFNSEQELREVVGPAVIGFSAIGLWHTKHRKLCLLIIFSGLAMTAVHFWPFKTIFKLFPFTLIYNTHFLYQFLNFSAVVVAGIGFSLVLENRSRSVLIFLNLICFSLLVVFLFIQLQFDMVGAIHNINILVIGSIVTAAIALIMNFAPSCHVKTMLMFIVSLYVITASLTYDNLPFAGEKIESTVYQKLRFRNDNMWKFKFERPDEVQSLILPKNLTESSLYLTSRGEYSSNLSLEDNSYKVGRSELLSAYPQEKSYYLFKNIPGAEMLMRNKFHFFDKYVLSSERFSLAQISEEPEVLRAMLSKRIALTNSEVVGGKRVSLAKKDGLISIEDTPSKRIPGNIKVKKYTANGIRFDIQLNQSGLLLYTDLMAPGWKAEVNGKPTPVVTVFETYKGLALKAGSHKVTFSYSSPAQYATVMMNIMVFIGLITLVAYALWPNFRSILFQKYFGIV